MKLAVSNIAWNLDEEAEIAVALQSMGVQYIEIAPTKKWLDPTIEASEQSAAEYKSFWGSYGIEVVAFQSMLFNRPDLKLFESEENRQETLNYLEKFIKLAGNFGVGAMVFGSPKNRQRNDMSQDEAMAIAAKLFDQLGNTAQKNGTIFCIEPNALQYNCDFITTAEQGIDIVRLVDNPGFRLHLDIACMTLAGDSIGNSIMAGKDYLQHFHISSPMLEDVIDRPDVNHREAAATLKSINYNNYVSIEMRPKAGNNIDRVKQAVLFTQEIYG